jgi:hypothetical protein
MVDVIGTRTFRTKAFIKVLTFTAAGRLRYPEAGKLSHPVDGFFINNYSSNEVWVNWDQDADLKQGDRIEAGDYRNIALSAAEFISVYADGAADSVILIGYHERQVPVVLAVPTGAARGKGRAIGYEDSEEERYAQTVLRAAR